MTDSIKYQGARRTEHLRDVFVLGAGVSVPYGFPTGAHLLSQMRQEDLSYSQQNYELLRIGLDSTLLPPMNFSNKADEDSYWRQSIAYQKSIQWKKLLRGSVVLSIDQFLKNLKDDTLRTFGKQIMARQILVAEKEACRALESQKNSDRQFPPKRFSMHKVDWIQQFLTRVDLLQNWDEYLKATTFLTFNYDRVLEFYLLRYLRNDRNLSPVDAQLFLKSLRIIHLNGHLGSLQELPFGNIQGVDEGFDPLFENIERKEVPVDWAAVGQRMRTVWETPDLHPEITVWQEQACEAVACSNRIFVMGTSFIPENFGAIGLTAEIRASTSNEQVKGIVKATTFSLSKAQKARAAELLGIYDWDLFDMNAEDFVVDHVVV